MRIFLKSIIISIFLSGCATANSISEDYSNVSYKDGVSKKEAKIIAKKELLDSGEKGSYMISLPDAEDKGAYWRVIFSSLYMNKFAYIVDIDKNSGKILKSFETDDIHEVFQK